MQEDDEAKKLVLDVDQASSLKAAFCDAGWKTPHIRALTRGDHLSKFRPVIEGYAEVRPRVFVVDLGVRPAAFIGGQVKLKLESHLGKGLVAVTREGDALYLDGKKVNLYVWKGQRRGCVSGEIERAVKGMAVLNANLARFLIKYPFMVPSCWYKYRQIFFWDTRYKSEIYGEYVVTLSMPNIIEMCLGYEHIKYGDGAAFDCQSPSAVLRLE